MLIPVFPQASLDTLPVDFAVAGEAEEVMVELVDLIEKGEDLTTVMNLTWRDHSGAAVSNPRRPVNADLDSLPFPSRDLVDYDAYLKNGMYEYGVITSRGCPYNCMLLQAQPPI